jgi:hypothetical protein
LCVGGGGGGAAGGGRSILQARRKARHYNTQHNQVEIFILCLHLS